VFFNGLMKMDVHGMKLLAVMRQPVAIYQYYSGHVQMDAHGMSEPAHRQPYSATSIF